MKTLDSNKKIKWGAILSYATVFVEVVLGLVYTPWMLKVIGADNYYLYTLGTTIMAMLLLDFGFGNAVNRFVAKYVAEGRQDLADQFLGMAYKIYLILDAIIFVVLLVLYLFIEQIFIGLTPQEVQSFKVVFLILGLFSLISFPTTPIKGVMNAYENFIAVKVTGLLTKLFTTLSIVVILILGVNLGWSSETCLFGLVGSHAVWGLFFIGVNYVVVRKKDPIRADLKHFDKSQFKEIISFSIWLTVYQLAERFFVLITPSIIGIISNSDSGSIFALGTQLEAYAYTLACAIDGLFMYRVASLINDKDDEGVFRLNVKVSKFQTVILGLVICGFIAIGIEFLQFWAGDGLAELTTISQNDAIWLTFITALSFFIPMLLYRTQSTLGVIAQAVNRIRPFAISYVVMAVIYIASAFIFGYFFGLVGIISSLAIVTILRTLLTDVIYHKKLNINMFRFFKETYLPVLIPLLITGAVAVAMNFLPVSGWLWMLIKAFVVVVIYGGLTLLFGLSKDERDTILKKLKIKKSI